MTVGLLVELGWDAAVVAGFVVAWLALIGLATVIRRGYL